MVAPVRVRIEPASAPRYPLPSWVSRGKGLVYEHQWVALTTTERRGRLHAPTGTGKSRAAAFFAVAPYLRNEASRIQATFAFPTNLLTQQQYRESLLEGLEKNLDFVAPVEGAWTSEPSRGETGRSGYHYLTMRMPGGEDLVVAHLTGEHIVKAIQAAQAETRQKKGDFLLDFLEWLNTKHNFIVASPDLLAYAAHEMYGISGVRYWRSDKRRLSNLLRERTLVIDEYHMYDPFTLVNFERLLEDETLRPSRVLLLSATPAPDYFPGVPPTLASSERLPPPTDEHVAGRPVELVLHFGNLPDPEEPASGLALWIHNSVVENRRRARAMRDRGVRIVQWDGTRKDEPDPAARLVLGTSAIEVGLHLPDATELHTEWSPSYMSAAQVVQRVGRVGRVPGDAPAVAHVFIPSVEGFREELVRLDGHTIPKRNLQRELERVRPARAVLRDRQISHYFGREDDTPARARLLAFGLQPRHRLRYSFRIPGSQGLFIDEENWPFVYDQRAIRNRYEVAPATPDRFPEEWRRFALGLGISEEHFFEIRGEHATRKWTPNLTGELEDLRKPTLRRFYVLGEEGAEDGSDAFL